MRNSVNRPAALTLATASVGLLLGFVTGCESQEHRASLQVQEDIYNADVVAQGAREDKDLNDLQKKFDAAAADTSAAKPFRVAAKARQAQLRGERANVLVARLREKDQHILVLAAQIGQLAAGVTQAGSYGQAMQGYDPSKAQQALKSKKAEIAGGGGGGADKGTWSDGAVNANDAAPPVALPTLAALKQSIETLDARIAENRKQLADLQAKQKDAATKADALQRKGEVDKGQQAVDDVTQAANFRRDAAYAGAQMDTLDSIYSRLQGDRAVAQAQQADFTAIQGDLDKQVTARDVTWKAVQDQIAGQKTLQTQLVNGFPAPNEKAPNITQLSEDLAQTYRDANALRDQINAELGGAIQQFGDVITMAQSVRTELMQAVGKKADAAEVAAYRQTMEMVNPNLFAVQKADLLRSQALVAANDAVVGIALAHMFDGFTVDQGGPLALAIGLDQEFQADGAAMPRGGSQKWAIQGLGDAIKLAGVDMPGPLRDLEKRPNPDDLKAAADKAFAAAVEAYSPQGGATDAGADATARRNAFAAGRSLTQRAWAEYALATGNPEAAKAHEADAVNAAGEVTDKAFLMIPSTQPAAPPAGTPGVTPGLPGAAMPGMPAAPGTLATPTTTPSVER